MTKTKPLPEKYAKTYLGPMNAEECEMLYRIVCLGVLSGDPSVRSTLFNKVQTGYENAKVGRSWTCTRDMMETEKSGKEKERV